MRIEISAKEYRELLDILHIADVIMSGHRREEDRRTEPHRALIQKLYGLARTEGLERLMTVNEHTGKSVPTGEFERTTPAHVLIEEFGDHLFWDQLIDRLSMRDAAQAAGGVEQLKALPDSDRQQAEGPFRKRYVEEFTSHGVTNLQVVERFGAAWGASVPPGQTSD